MVVIVIALFQATQLIKQGLEDENFKDLVDKRLEQYDVQQLREMTTCAALCVRKNPTDRPKMSEVIVLLLSVDFICPSNAQEL